MPTKGSKDTAPPKRRRENSFSAGKGRGRHASVPKLRTADPLPSGSSVGIDENVPPPIRIALADDHALFREGLKSVLALRPEVQVVADAERVEDVAPMLARHPCDVLLLDLQMDRSVLSDMPALTEKTAVIIVTASEALEDAVAAIRAGARGVIFKRFAVEDLMRAVRAVVEGDVWMPSSLQAHLAAGLHTSAREPLTRREREIVHLVALGLRNAEVARKVFIAEQTVKTHLNNIFRKLGVRDRVELTLYAARVGIIGVRENVREKDIRYPPSEDET